jgi:hypothetical protein
MFHVISYFHSMLYINLHLQVDESEWLLPSDVKEYSILMEIRGTMWITAVIHITAPPF